MIFTAEKYFHPTLMNNKKYPVLVYLYGGPHIQRITNRMVGRYQS